MDEDGRDKSSYQVGQIVHTELSEDLNLLWSGLSMKSLEVLLVLDYTCYDIGGRWDLWNNLDGFSGDVNQMYWDLLWQLDFLLDQELFVSKWCDEYCVGFKQWGWVSAVITHTPLCCRFESSG